LGVKKGREGFDGQELQGCYLCKNGPPMSPNI